MIKLSILLSYLFLFLTVNAQIVNIENKRLSAKKEGFSGSVDINVSYTLNSKELLQIGDKVQLAYKKDRHYVMLLTDHAFVKSSTESFINKGFEHVRYNYTLKDSNGRVIYEAFHQGQFNKIQRINMRILVGTGFRFNIIDRENYQFSYGTSLMGEHEELTEGSISQDILSSNYLSFDGQFTESFGLNSITYFQPKLIDYGNYRLSTVTSLRFRFNKFLTFKIVYSLNHDNRDIEGVRKTNYNLLNTLSFNF